jgi:hypothetical protein
MSRLSHFLDSRLTDGGEDVSLRRRPPFAPRKIPGTHFCWRLIRPQGHSAAGRIRPIEKSNDLIENRTRDRPVCSIVPQCYPMLEQPIYEYPFVRNLGTLEGFRSVWRSGQHNVNSDLLFYII